MTTGVGGEQPFLSVVIPTLGRDSLGDQLEALSACTWDGPWEVVVADNSGSGRAADACERWAGRIPGLRVIDASGRPGRSYAVNQGARAARGRWLLLCDDDDLVLPDFIAAPAALFSSGALAVAFNLDVRSVNPGPVWQSLRHHTQLERLQPMFRGLPAVWGCCGVDRGLFLALGGFDESLAYAEDLAFSVRLHDEGITPTWLPARLIRYRLRSTYRGRFHQAAVYARSLEVILDRYPSLRSAPTPPRWKLWALTALTALRGAPSLLSWRGRLASADELGSLWGQVAPTRPQQPL